MVLPAISEGQSSVPIIRFFCSFDDSPLGKTSLAYADAFAGMNLTMRLLATRVGLLGQLAPAWARHQHALLTPMIGAFINVVCGTASDWKRLYTVGVKNILITEEKPPQAEVASAQVLPIPNLHTRKDELVTIGADELAREVALKYQTIIVPTEEISLAWHAIGGNAIVISKELGQYALALKRALFS